MIGQKKTKIFWHQSEARITPTVWNWSVKTLSPGALILVLDFSSPEFFSRMFRLSLPPLTAPGSPRMTTTRRTTRAVLRHVCFLSTRASLSCVRVCDCDECGKGLFLVLYVRHINTFYAGIVCLVTHGM